MKSGCQKKSIYLSQITNRDQARYRVLFKSEAEAKDPEEWRKILSNQAGGRKYEIIVCDNTPDEISGDLKKYSILYGLKRLYAAEQLGLESIQVKVTSETQNIDMKVATRFFNADFSSMDSYERGEFLEKVEREMDLGFDYIARNSGFSFNTLNSIRTAYHDSLQNISLRNAYRDGLIPMNLVSRTRKYYEIIPFSDHKKLTDFIVENKFEAVEKIARAVETKRKNVTIPQAIRREILRQRKPVLDEEKTGKKLTDKLLEGYMLPAGCDPLRIEKRMKQDSRFSKQIKNYLTLREKCCETYDGLCGVLPVSLILDFMTALTLPNKSKKSYNVPKEIRTFRDYPKSKNGRRLLARILEYMDTVWEDRPQSLRVEAAANLYSDNRIQHAFAVFFRYSILYRSEREKIIRAV